MVHKGTYFTLKYHFTLSSAIYFVFCDDTLQKFDNEMCSFPPFKTMDHFGTTFMLFSFCIRLYTRLIYWGNWYF